jgi:hypothetical protein
VHLFDAGVCYMWLCKVDYLIPWSNLMPVCANGGFLRSTILVRGLI